MAVKYANTNSLGIGVSCGQRILHSKCHGRAIYTHTSVVHAGCGRGALGLSVALSMMINVEDQPRLSIDTKSRSPSPR